MDDEQAQVGDGWRDDDDDDDWSCPQCGGRDEDGYEDCPWAGSEVYAPGPGGPDVHGCPYLTGTY